jgi:hypothetical protein
MLVYLLKIHVFDKCLLKIEFQKIDAYLTYLGKVLRKKTFISLNYKRKYNCFDVSTFKLFLKTFSTSNPEHIVDNSSLLFS